MGVATPPTSPYQFYDSGSDYRGRHITGTVTFDGANNLTGGTVTRDAGCMYTRIVLGMLNADGSPAAGSKVIDVSGLSGPRSFTKAQLNSVGLVTVDDIMNAPQI
jgi:hypothetical protein